MSNNKKMLKLNKPMIYCHTVIGAMSSIAEEKDLGWIFSNFTQIMYNDDWREFIFDDQNRLLETCPFIQMNSVMFEKSEFNSQLFIDRITYMIDNDCYAFLFLDRKILSINDSHFAHTTLISGYDKDKKVFYLNDNYDQGRFITIEMDMETTAEAFRSAWTYTSADENYCDRSEVYPFLRNVSMLKYNTNVSISMDIDNFYRQLKCFINAESIFLFCDRKKAHFGFNVYQLIIDILHERCDFPLETKDFHVLYEHKLVMKKRIEYMISSGFLPSDKGYLEISDRICDEFMAIRNLYLKSMIGEAKSKNNIIEKICERLRDSQKIEIKFYNNLISEYNKS
ncbi:MAG: hypothetical protein LBM93_14575 [Oscillospiraceae bacterium]|jgi:hypothetical protein|nr:hypothetical protein [Oscillospiraceae bacterium]